MAFHCHSSDIIASIKRFGDHPRYTEFPSLGHTIYDEIKVTPGVLDWIFAQKQK